MRRINLLVAVLAMWSVVAVAAGPPTCHVGGHLPQTVSGSDGSTIPLGTLTVTSSNLAIATVTVDPATNKVTITCIANGNSSLTYSAPLYTTSVITMQVLPKPGLIVVDGVEF